jgi:hypothetical protein
MKLYVKLEDLTFNGPGVADLKVPSMPIKVFELSNKPVSSSKIFEGIQLLNRHSKFPITIKWALRYGNVVRLLQQQLIDNPKLDNITQWTNIISKPDYPSPVKAFIQDDKELSMTGNFALIIERENNLK